MGEKKILRGGLSGALFGRRVCRALLELRLFCRAPSVWPGWRGGGLGGFGEMGRAAWGRRPGKASRGEQAKGRFKGLLTTKCWGARDSGRDVFILCSKGGKRGGGSPAGGGARGAGAKGNRGTQRGRRRRRGAFTDPGGKGKGGGGSGKTAGRFRDGVGGYLPIHSTAFGAGLSVRRAWGVAEKRGRGFGNGRLKFFKGAS